MSQPASTVVKISSATSEDIPLPDGWRWVRVGDVSNLVNGDAYKPHEWSTSGVPIIRIQNLNDESKPYNYWSGSLNNRVKVKTGDVLLAWSGTPGTSFGTHLWQRGEGVLNQHIFRVDLKNNNIVPTWFVYATNHRLHILIDKAHGGVGLRHVTKGEVEKLEIPLPPVNEQKRLANVLTEQMTAVARARAAAEAQLKAAKDLPAAYLRTVFDDSESQGWQFVKVGDISSLIIDGPHVTPMYVPKGVPFVTVRNIVNRRVDLSQLSYITETDHAEFARRGKAEKGDILYTKDGTLGIPCVVDIDEEFSFFVSVALIKLIRERADSRFVAYALESPMVLKQVELLGAGAGLKHMVLRSIRALEIPLPPMPEQRKIADTLNEQMLKAEQTKKILKDQLDSINKLPAALLRQAFSGKF